MTLEPKLTSLDERVLTLLPGEPPGVRASDVHRRLAMHLHRYDQPHLSPAQLRLILRGFEHLGKATGRGGWWRQI